VHDAFEHHRLAGFRGRDNEAALTFADWCGEVDDAWRQVLRTAVAEFECESFISKQRVKFYE
jgi:hypothetical protein